jgi:uncharacterized protein YdeI (YjbR/CyaY-like superfamily)
MKPKFFRSADEFREWLAANHDCVTELWLGFYKKDSGRKGIAYKDAVDEALCWGWIDGLRRSHNEQSYVNRFTPRKPKSVWSAVNMKRIEELIQAGRMAPPGLRVFEARDPSKVEKYSYEQQQLGFDSAAEKKFRANRKAWAFFEKQAPFYRRVSSWWVVSAKKEETRARRLETLIAKSERGERLDQFGGQRLTTRK